MAIQKVQQRLLPSPTPSVPIQSPSSSDSIFVKSEYRVQKIDLKDIKYLEDLGDYVAIHTNDGKILTSEKMKDFEKTLPSQDFMRVHKSYIIAFAKIDFIERNRIFMGKALIPISETYKQAFWKRIKH